VEEKKNQKSGKAKGFFGKLVDKLDKKMKEKANAPRCCCGDDSKNSSCCG
jgi:hypothetical protein